MKETEKRTIEREKTVALICDSCGRRDDLDNIAGGWSTDSDHHYAETRIKFSETTSYPGDAWGVFMEELDICPQCFKEFVIPALEEIIGRPIEMKDF